MSSILKFICRPGTATHAKLVALQTKMNELDETTNEFRKAQGWGSLVLVPSGRVAGGIFAVHFPEPPKDWRSIGEYGMGNDAHTYYRPIQGRKSTRDMMVQLAALPQMGNREFNQAIGAETPWSHFGLGVGPEGCFLLEIYEDMEYTANDLEEITHTHYKELAKQAKAENE